ncbi:MAG: hypothetical protein ACXWZB_07805 [Gaiellaceae bacterium]
MSATVSSASRTRSRLAALVAVATLAALAAGCGGDGSPTAGETATTAGDSLAASIEQALYEKGDTQEVVCEGLGAVDVSGVSREIARCAFTEEKDGAGEMRPKAGCFVLENGAPLDVTMDVPADVSCVTPG